MGNTFVFLAIVAGISAFSHSLKPVYGFCPNFTGMIPGWSKTRVVKKTVQIGCISRSWGQERAGFSLAIDNWGSFGPPNFSN